MFFFFTIQTSVSGSVQSDCGNLRYKEEILMIVVE